MVHIRGKCNVIAALLSRWITITNPQETLEQLLSRYEWVSTHIDLTAVNHNI